MRTGHVFLILFGIWMFCATNNYLVLKGSSYIVSPDPTTYFGETATIFHHLQETRMDSQWVREFFSLLGATWKPPLFYLTGCFALLFGVDEPILALLNNLFYLSILLFATYGIGKKLKGRETGVLSAFLIAMLPVSFALSRMVMIEFSLTAMVALVLYVFLLNNFNSFIFSLTCGMVIGAGCLTKQTYFIFFLPILACSVISNLGNGNFKNPRFLCNFILSLLLGVLIALTWYHGHGNLTLQKYYYYISLSMNQADMVPFFYLKHMFTPQLGPALFCLFLVSFVRSLYKKELFLPSAIVFVLLVFSVSTNKSPRFVLPVYVFIAVMIAEFAMSLKRSRRILVAGLISYSLLGYLVISHDNFLPKPLQSILAANLYYFDAADVKGNWINKGLYRKIHEGQSVQDIEQVAKKIRDEIFGSKTGHTADVLGIVTFGEVWLALEYLEVTERLPIRKEGLIMDFEFELKNKSYYDDHINKFEFILAEEGAEKRLLHAKALIDALGRNMDNFKVLARFPSPTVYDGSVIPGVTLYQKIRKIPTKHRTGEEAPDAIRKRSAFGKIGCERG